ncbi:MAG: methyltransferase domain-containing protein [Thiogranum sp.]
MICHVCGGDEFDYSEVLWDELIAQWQLAEYEVDYINRQQGEKCIHCSSNLRSIALAKAILGAYGVDGTLYQFVTMPKFETLRVLEVNHAGTLSPVLEKLRSRKLITYPEHDMMNLDMDSDSYELVIHSDTLEHVENPIIGLSECNRVLVSGGRCIFTVPIIVDRLSRSRAGLADSYHGKEDMLNHDYKVNTEFGMDVWKYVLKAGFSEVNIHCIAYPAALAIEAKK